MKKLELRSIKLIEIEGKPTTRIVEGEGAAESVRNYSNPAEAIAYLNERVPYYHQPLVDDEDIPTGREETEEDGSKSLVFPTIQSAIFHLATMPGAVKEAPEAKTPEAGTNEEPEATPEGEAEIPEEAPNVDEGTEKEEAKAEPEAPAA